MIFDGQTFAVKLEQQLKEKIGQLSKKLKLAVWLDPTNTSGAKYVDRKMKVAHRLGIEIVLNKVDGNEDGVMVQLPHPQAKQLISQIDPAKDVDGLRLDSPYQPAVVRAVLEILGRSFKVTPYRSVPMQVVVIGDQGFVGKKLIEYLALSFKHLEVDGMDKDDFDVTKLQTADVVISCTGQASLIKPEMVKDGIIAIDVGYPHGDFDPKVANKASFFTPVPGGVGPVTVTMLFANLLESVIK